MPMSYHSRLLYLGPMLCLLSVASFDQDGKFYLNQNWDCELNGQPFKVENGILDKKENISGHLQCSSEKKTVYDATFKNGEVYEFKTIGANRVIEETFTLNKNGNYEIVRFAGTQALNPKQSITQYNSNDQEHGTTKYFSQKGKLEKEQQFQNGQLEGWSKTYYESGKENLSEWFSKNELTLSFNRDENQKKLLGLECLSKDEADYPLDELKRLCGFNWPLTTHAIYALKDGKVVLDKKVLFKKGFSQEETSFLNDKISSTRVKKNGLILKKIFNDEEKLKVIEGYQAVDAPGNMQERGRRLFKIDYIEGEVSRLDCGNQGYFEEDKKLCGFKSEAIVSFYSYRPGTKELEKIKTVIMKDGKEYKPKEGRK